MVRCDESGRRGLGETSGGFLRGKWEEGFGKDFRWFVKRKVGGEVSERLQGIC